jgi:hypothetical protein
VLEPVTPPAVVPREDLGLRSAKQAAALVQANRRIDEGRHCHQKIRETFAAGAVR